MECLDLLHLWGGRDYSPWNGILPSPLCLGCYFLHMDQNCSWHRKTISCQVLGLNMYLVPAGGATVGIFSSNRVLAVASTHCYSENKIK